MLNEFVYCPRLFYYEYVEGVFVHNADTVRGAAIHKRVDAGEGGLPPATDSAAGKDSADAASETPAEPEVIHSRSVQMGSSRLGVIAKMDLVEVRQGLEAGQQAELFAQVEVSPVDYKAGAPRRTDSGNALWDADRMQLGLQCLILRDNGYACREGLIYYRATRQRVRLAVTAELEAWILARIAEAREAAAGSIPPPLEDSPKCPRCSLVGICLPDETRLLAAAPADEAAESPAATPTDAVGKSTTAPSASQPSVRRLLAPRDDARALYLNTQGLRIGRKEHVLQIKQERETLDEVRISDLTHVALFGNIQLTTQAIQTLCSAGVPVTWFSMGGWFYGLTRGHELKNVFLRIEQFRAADDPARCLPLARGFVHGKIRNQRTMLMRNHVEAPAPLLLRLKEAANRALEAVSLEQLLGIEGAAAAAYFGEFAGMLKTAAEPGDETPPETPSPAAPPFTFDFNGRNRRPPTDPVNALLSLAYSLLTKDCLLAAYAVGFDPYVGFFHQPRFGRPALALDLMEEFRPLVADSTVLSCINNRVLTPADFVRAGDAVNLATAGRRRFFELYEQRMNSLLTHPVFDYKVSYRRALELQARLLAKCLTGEIPAYQPLMTR
ncbi:MAG: CRISPR-associated endonuclease Cas1 [Verrucomicrobiales bacterium]|nr:CRISPR-associated endonuclease Cas1 [Verrucomicrobiales bacterium]